MAKQILITQYDFGIIFNVTLIDEDKKPIIIGTDNVKFYVKLPSGDEEDINDVSIISEDEGIVEFTLGVEHTSEIGNHSVYVEISSPEYEITGVFAQSYYVMSERGA